MKREQGLMWQELVKGDTRGEEVLDPALVEEIHKRFAHLCSDKEVCNVMQLSIMAETELPFPVKTVQ